MTTEIGDWLGAIRGGSGGCVANGNGLQHLPADFSSYAPWARAAFAAQLGNDFAERLMIESPVGHRADRRAVGIVSLLFGLAGRFVLYGAIWWLLTNGRPDALVFGACCAAAAALVPLVIGDAGDAAAQRALLPTVLRLPLLLPFFLWQSLRGGVDVALRALKPRLPLAPAMMDYRLRLPPGPAPVMMASLVSLMPGTLAMISGTRLKVHVLDARRDYSDELERLEALVARVFGIALGAPNGSAGKAGEGGRRGNDA